LAKTEDFFEKNLRDTKKRRVQNPIFPRASRPDEKVPSFGQSTYVNQTARF